MWKSTGRMLAALAALGLAGALHATEVAPRGGDYGTHVAQAKSGCDDCVLYTAFDGEQFELRRLAGLHVELLYPASSEPYPRLNDRARARLLDSSDLAYATLAEWYGAEPEGEGLLTIALLPRRDAAAAARGWAGAKGVEIYSSFHGGVTETELDAPAGRLAAIVVHELTHNFDLARRIAVQTNDLGHFLTAIIPRLYELHHQWQPAAITFPGDFDRQLRGADEIVERFGRHRLRWLVELAQGDLRGCTVERDCGGLISRNSLGAAIVFRSAEGQPPAFWPGYFRAARALSDARQTHAYSTTSLDAQLVALSRARGDNLLCLADAFGWTPDPDYAQQLAADGLPRSPLCDDADGDGAVAFIDPDDTEAAARFGLTEVRDGIDNDGNGIVDDIAIEAADYLAQAAPQWPVAIRGRGAAIGSLWFDLPRLPGDRAIIELCGNGASQIYADLMRGRAGLGLVTDAGVSPRCNRNEVRLSPGDSATPPRLRLDLQPGVEYRVAVAPLPDLPAPISAVAIDRVLQHGVDTLRYRRFMETPLPEGAVARLWIAGEGFVAQAAAASRGEFEVPERLRGRAVAARVQLLHQDRPVDPTSDLFDLDVPVATRSFDDFTGGFFNDPRRSGEGWQVVPGMIGDQRYMFVTLYAQLRPAFQRDRHLARWFVGVVPFPEGRDAFEVELHTAYSGTGGFDQPSTETYAAAVATITRRADGLLQASAITPNGESSQGLLQPTARTSGEASPLGGIWIKPGVSGEALFVQPIELDDGPGVSVAWFGFCNALAANVDTCDHTPHWLAGFGRSEGSRAELTVYEALGGDFGVLQDPADVEITERGTLTLASSGCGRLHLRFDRIGGEPLEAELALEGRIEGSIDCPGR